MAEEEKNIEESGKKKLSVLELKWKSWYWYILILANASVPLFLALNRILLFNEQISTSSGQLALLILAPPTSLCLILTYLYSTLKNYRDFKVFIKPIRIRYLWRGGMCSFLSFCFLLVSLLTSYQLSNANIANKIVVFTFLGISCLTGTISSVFTTMYEFCVSFDIFYSKNKELIVKEYLKTQGKLKIKDGEPNENKEI